MIHSDTTDPYYDTKDLDHLINCEAEVTTIRNLDVNIPAALASPCTRYLSAGSQQVFKTVLDQITIDFSE